MGRRGGSRGPRGGLGGVGRAWVGVAGAGLVDAVGGGAGGPSARDTVEIMAEALRERPEGSIVLLRLGAHIEARPKPVLEAIERILDPGQDAHSGFLADHKRSLIVAQGGWWYRAEYRVVPDDKGSHVEHVLVNTSGRETRFGKPVGRKQVAAAPAEFERLITRLREELE